MGYTPLNQLSDSDLHELQQMLVDSEKNGGWGSRKPLIEQYGYDTKFATHCLRLLAEVEQILTEGDLDLERNREQLKSIRRGDWTLERIEDYFQTKEKVLETLYSNSTIPYGPDEDAIKRLLLECLEIHYGSLDGAIKVEIPVEKLLRDMQAVIDRYK